MTARATATTVTREVERVIDQYISAWNETDSVTRRELNSRTSAEDGSYVDPLISGLSHEGIDAMIASVQTQFPGYRFRRAGKLDAHNNVVRFSWELGPEDGPALAGGVDFGVIVEDRLQSITGFLDFAPGADG